MAYPFPISAPPQSSDGVAARGFFFVCLLALVMAGPGVAAQSEADPADARDRGPSRPAADGQASPPGARFEVQPTRGMRAADADGTVQPDGTLEGPTTDDPWALALVPPPPSEELSWTGAGVLRRAASPATGPGRADRWARGLFASDAENLTPLGEGHRVLSFDVARGLSVHGVGSRRVWTERDRTYVLSAEAGLDVSSRIGFSIGYELFQASAGEDVSPELESDSLFARFRLRF